MISSQSSVPVVSFTNSLACYDLHFFIKQHRVSKLDSINIQPSIAVEYSRQLC